MTPDDRFPTHFDTDYGRVCLVDGCGRLSSDSGAALCKKHHDLSGIQDPLLTLQRPPGSVPGWKAIAGSRLAQLNHPVRSSFMVRGGHQRSARRWAAPNEKAWIEGLALPHAVAEVLSETHRNGLPSWRVPDSVSLYQTIAQRWPALLAPPHGFGDEGPRLEQKVAHGVHAVLHRADFAELKGTLTSARAIDWIARALMETESPTPPPFLPLTSPRTLNREHQQALEEQEAGNLPQLLQHADMVHRLKHARGRRLLTELFADDAIDDRVPEGVVVFHQIGKPQHLDDLRDRLAATALDRHLTLNEGDIVRYRHVMSATVNTRWHAGLGSESPRWLTEGGAENAVRLELAPRRGIYVGPAVCDVINSHLGGERELVLPGDTIWRVEGIRDVAQPDVPERDQARYRIGSMWTNAGRLRNILMSEIDEAELPTGCTIIEMTVQ